MKARVFATLKPSVFDPQGRTVVEALHSLGHTKVGDVRQGKYFDINLKDGASLEHSRKIVERLAKEVLTNPVIEQYRIVWES